ncbi:hypothetical protein BH18ACT2_BH18ACT2_20700 [soil metagenome]
MVAGTLATTGLGAAAAIHGAWAAGSTWPADSPVEWADLVVGRQPPPSPAMCLGVVGLLTSAAAAVAVDSLRRQRPDTPLARSVQLAARAVAGVLAVRGIAGLVTSAVGVGSSTPQYRKWDLLLYSPLCLALSAATFVGTANPHE